MYTTFKALLGEQYSECFLETGRLRVPQKSECSAHRLKEEKVLYGGNWYKCIRSSANRISLETDTRGSFEIVRTECKIKDFSFSITTWINRLSTKLGKKVTYTISQGCQLHGNQDYKIYIDEKLEYLIPQNY